MASNTKKLITQSMHIAIIALCAQLSFPSLLWVPFTLQLLGITVVSRLSMPKDAVITTTLYLCIGLIGFPVFAGGSGGISMLMSPTFGFILGFIPLSYGISKSPRATLLGYFLLYLLGISYLLLIVNGFKGGSMSLWLAIQSSMLPFIATDVLMISLGIFCTQRLLKFGYNRS